MVAEGITTSTKGLKDNRKQIFKSHNKEKKYCPHRIGEEMRE